ncbi:MAG: MBL fold metallo-hydrolase [Peptostreptococcaceae bacterium]
MKITYINHSCFSLELNDCILLFDYFEGQLPNWSKNKKLYVLSSHSHKDHYSSSIFNLKLKYPYVKYILSEDIDAQISDNTYFIKVNETVFIDDLEIRTLKSTDIGVAFIIKLNGRTIYHAGDLNWWHWEGENSDYVNNEAEQMYKKEIEKIKNIFFDVAFVPLDPRQGEQFYYGFDTFMKSTNTKIVFPMHCWDDYTVISKLKKLDCSDTYLEKIIDISYKNQEFII